MLWIFEYLHFIFQNFFAIFFYYFKYYIKDFSFHQIVCELFELNYFYPFSHCILLRNHLNLIIDRILPLPFRSTERNYCLMIFIYSKLYWIHDYVLDSKNYFTNFVYFIHLVIFFQLHLNTFLFFTMFLFLLLSLKWHVYLLVIIL
jgi:hypothetical protein